MLQGSNTKNKMKHGTYTTESLHLTPPLQKYCEICRLRGMKKRAVLEDKIDDIDYSLCWDCSLDNRTGKEQNVAT